MKRQILGLDISDDFVAAAVVQQTGQERKILSCGFLELRSRKDLGEVLPALLQQVSWGGGTCICGISLDRISLRNLKVPFTDRKKLSQVLPLELEDQFLVPAGEQVIDYMTTATTESGASLLVAGIEKEQLRSDIDAMHNGGVKPLCLTLRNLALAEKLIESNSVSGDFILLDLGACSMNILFVHNSRVVFIRRLACPERMFTQAPFSFQNGLAKITHPEETTACITTLCADIHRSIGFYRLESQADFQPQTVVLSGSLANIAECREVIRTELELDVVTSNLQESAKVGLDDDVRAQWRPAVLDHALALALRSIRKRSSIDFRKDEFAPDRYLFASKTQLAAAAAVAVLLLGSALVLLGFDYSSLKNRHDRMGEEMAELYRETFPGATKIIDPLVQMQANVRDVQAPSIATPVFSGEKRVLNILADISARVSESIVLQVSRMVIDQESVQIKGLTDTFNNVNLIQGSLQRSPNFDEVAIVSAAADKETGMIRFELRLQTGGGS